MKKNYASFLYEDKDAILERYALAEERIMEIVDEQNVEDKFKPYFRKTAAFINMINRLDYKINNGIIDAMSLSELEMLNYSLYSNILPENYDESYGNPKVCIGEFGEEYGRILCFLYAEIRGMIVCTFEGRCFANVILMELFIEIYNLFENKEEFTVKQVQDAVYYFISDYSDITVKYRVRQLLDRTLDYATRIVMESDLYNLRYLYEYGEYISSNETKLAEFLNKMPQEKINSIAKTFTEAFREAFINNHIDMTKKKYVNIRYPIGFERVVKAAILQFREMGLEPIMFPVPVNRINKKQNIMIGYFSTSPNKQYEYDHRFDDGIYLDKAFIERKIEVLRSAYEEYKDLAALYAGPAVVEIFGEEAFEPKLKKESISLSKEQQELSLYYTTESSKIINHYINREEYEFTIIAYPLPEIGDNFEEIFEEIIKVNNLDKEMYKRVQQRIIDVLDTAVNVRVVGKGENKTNIIVNLCELKDPSRETKFENCLADVNIPVGEVFTSPKLMGTNGVLNVSEVYLDELKYKNLLITFENGKIKDYTCNNFEKEEDNKKFIKENLLNNRETLPIGEFAIGTNTTAYVMAHKYNIVYKLPILIVEKMGPHFAVGDTCYSHSEENKLYNPNGKEIVAKDNECSILRNTDINNAYFNCHTDITIPYDEIESISAIMEDKTEVKIIENGRFVLEGTEEFNIPFNYI